MESFQCNKECCSIKITPYIGNKKITEIKKYKAGVFIYDPNTNKILLVQSRGNLWGPPKGTLKEGEDEKTCAIREVNEETGLNISDEFFSRITKIQNNAVYFYLEKPICNVEIQTTIEENDANGITWIKPECLLECINSNKMFINYHCKILLHRFLDLMLKSTDK